MLYPKQLLPMTDELFKNPGSEYRGTPFWAWNSKLEKNELLRQIDVLKEMGYGGFHMHVRTGMATSYLSDEHMDLVKACVEKAKDEKMLAWLYDEDRWPSGAAGGFVTQNPEHRLRHLLLTRVPYGQSADSDRVIQSSAKSGRTENGELIACFDVILDKDGNLGDYRQVKEDSRAEGFKLYAYVESAEPSPWYNNQTYADTLNPETMAEFIRITYERYNEYFANDFGNVIPAIFTDEPQFSHKSTLNFANEAMDITLPWTPDLPETFREAYPGEDLISHIPELLWELTEEVSRTRYLYHDHIAERFAKAFADQCGKWCKEHGLMLTGHMMEEPTLQSQTQALGDAMRSYRGFQLPGIDMLCNAHEYTTAKQAQSACHQYGAPGVMSELYGVTNWDYDFRSHKLQGDWQAALGITVRVPHLSWVSMNGEAKRDYPATFNYQVPWHDQYSLVEDHFARVNTAMTRGTPFVRIGVIHPVESYWLHWGTKEKTRGIREQKDEQFKTLTDWLLLGLMDFDFIAESLLPEQCDVAAISNTAFPVGQMRYDVVIVPGCETLRATTLERLEAFRNAGGRVIFMGNAPRYQDARVNDRGLKLFDRSERIAFEKIALMEILEDLREIDIRDQSGGQTDHLLYQLRSEDDCRWLFVCHGTDPVNKDLVKGDNLRIRMRGEWNCALYDTINGESMPYACSVEEGWTVVDSPFYDHDSLLLRFTPADAALTRSGGHEAGTLKQTNVQKPALPYEGIRIASANDVQRFLAPVPVTLEEPNVLLLDIAEYKLDEEPYRPAEEILRLDNVLRSELGWPLRMEAVVQPWVESDESTPRNITLRFRINAGVSIDGTKLCLERSDLASIRFDGADVPVRVSGWYVDKCIHCVELPLISTGEHFLEITYRYGRKVDLEYLYLIGDFGVDVKGCVTTLTAPVQTLAFGDITGQGLPFYGGNLVYHLDADVSSKGEMTVQASCYRGHLLGVEIDGVDQGRIIYSPYRLKITDLTPGKHKVDLRCYGSRVNTFGQLHCNCRSEEGFWWWGPNSWRTAGDLWTYEYRFWKQGVLKSPEIESK